MSVDLPLPFWPNNPKTIPGTISRSTPRSTLASAVLEELLAGPRQETIAAKRAELRAQQSQRQVLAGQLARRKQLVQSASVSREEYETFLYDYEAIVALIWDLPDPPNYAILRRQAESLEDRLRAIHGTRDVDIYGDPQEEIVVEIDQAELV